MDYTKMTGYEFEDFIANMLRKYGFMVEQTDYSGDGGIDIIATYNKPLFCGKYIVQCKNYTGLVGQPEVRDLFGVVASENANKGIIITPADFSDQAYSFAEGKNIELINGVILKQLVGQEGSISDICNSFVDYHDFNRTRYDYLRTRIEHEPTDFKNYYELYEFLRQYIENGAVDICENGLIQEIVSVVQRGKERCFKAKSKKLYRDICDLYVAQILIATGEIGQATQLVLETGNNNDYFYFRKAPRLMPLVHEGYNDSDIYKPVFKVQLYEPFSSNLYSAFYHMGYQKGCELIKRNVPKVLTRESYGQFFSQPNREFDRWEDRYIAFINHDIEEDFYFCDERYYTTHSYGKKKELILFGLKKALSTKWLRKNYYKKTDSDLINEVESVFKQMGINI